jgi:hypothetical protein
VEARLRARLEESGRRIVIHVRFLPLNSHLHTLLVFMYIKSYKPE